MNKKEFIAKIATLAGATQMDIKTIYDALYAVVVQDLIDTGQAKLPDIVSFKTTERAATTERHVTLQGKDVVILASLPSKKVVAKIPSTIKQIAKNGKKPKKFEKIQQLIDKGETNNE